MRYCPKCRVSLGENVDFCPLCGARGVDALEETPASEHAPVSWTREIRDAEQSRVRLLPAERRKIAFEILAVSFAIALVVTLGLDFLANHRFTWSLYAGLAILFAGLCATMPLILWGRPWLVYAVLGPSLLLCVFLWALFSGGTYWFLPIALPLVVLIEGVVVAALPIIAVQRRKGLNTLAVILLAIAVLCVGIETILSIFAFGAFSLTWSLVVVVVSLPVAGLFMYLHYRVMNRASLRRIFRL